MDKTALARQALRASIELRANFDIAEDAPICIYDLAQTAGLDVRFCTGDTFEGMYSKGTKTILVPTTRPRGRQAFACAHEMGHWYFGHGSRLEQLVERLQSNVNPEEFIADVFAGYLLMSPWAIRRALTRRKLHAKNIAPHDLYALASQFNVGYTSLADHLFYSLKLISRSQHVALKTPDVKSLRKKILGRYDNEGNHAPMLDHAWETIPLDLQVGDIAVLPADSQMDATNVIMVGTTENGNIVKALRPGIGRCHLKNTSMFIRVARSEFSGRAVYRHLDDPDVN